MIDRVSAATPPAEKPETTEVLMGEPKAGRRTFWFHHVSDQNDAYMGHIGHSYQAETQGPIFLY